MSEKSVKKDLLGSQQRPVAGEAGKTGCWRTVRPILDIEICTVSKNNKHTCHLCWLYCPEMVMSRGIPPEINYDYCKGCGICATECPVGAIKMVSEAECVENERKEAGS